MVELRVPSAARVAALLAWPLLVRLRAFVLYYRLPYDRTFWAKLRDPRTLLVMMIASSPNVYLRGLFFSLYFASILLECDEFQLSIIEYN